MVAWSGSRAFKKTRKGWFLKVFLSVLKLAVYSKSSFLAKVLLSFYGFVEGVAVVPKKRLSAVKSLLRYGVDVIQKS
jgi:hypothetical protein